LSPGPPKHCFFCFHVNPPLHYPHVPQLTRFTTFSCLYHASSQLRHHYTQPTYIYFTLSHNCGFLYITIMRRFNSQEIKRRVQKLEYRDSCSFLPSILTHPILPSTIVTPSLCTWPFANSSCLYAPTHQMSPFYVMHFKKDLKFHEYLIKIINNRCIKDPLVLNIYTYVVQTRNTYTSFF